MKPEVASIAANLIINELTPRLKRSGIRIENSPVTPVDMRLLACLKYCDVLSTRDIRETLDEMFH